MRSVVSQFKLPEGFTSASGVDDHVTPRKPLPTKEVAKEYAKGPLLCQPYLVIIVLTLVKAILALYKGRVAEPKSK
jgi:hypothetical protein